MKPKGWLHLELGPFSSPLKPSELASAGFFFLEKPDTVECFACGSYLREWEHGDSAMSEHHKLCPDCPFVNGKETGNVPMNPNKDSFGNGEAKSDESFLAVLREREKKIKKRLKAGALSESSCDLPQYSLPLQYARHSEYVNENKRMQSFNKTVQENIMAQHLANAGFFCKDVVCECFYCGVHLKISELSRPSDPWIEHARRFPVCSFLIHMKGLKWVNSNRIYQPLDVLDQQSLGSLSSSISNREISHHDLPFSSHHSRTIDSLQSVNEGQAMDNLTVELLLEKGYRKDIVKEALKRHPGNEFPKTLDLIQAVQEIEREELEKSVSTEDKENTSELVDRVMTGEGGEPVSSLESQPPSLESLASIVEPTVEPWSMPPNFRNAVSGPEIPSVGAFSTPPNFEQTLNSSQVSELQKELQECKNRLQCKICLENDSCMVLFPCKHVATCMYCVCKCSKCPVCRMPISRSTYIFIS